MNTALNSALGWRESSFFFGELLDVFNSRQRCCVHEHTDIRVQERTLTMKGGTVASIL